MTQKPPYFVTTGTLARMLGIDRRTAVRRIHAAGLAPDAHLTEGGVDTSPLWPVNYLPEIQAAIGRKSDPVNNLRAMAVGPH